MRKSRLQFAITVLIAMFAFSELVRAQHAPAVDLTKSSEDISDNKISIKLSAVPIEEVNAKNELNVFSPALVVGPAEKDELSGRQGRLVRWRHELVGQKVVVEGIAMGRAQSNPHVMTNQRIIYEGGVIYIKGVDFFEKNASGRLVRVTGRLRLEPETTVEFDGHDPQTVHKYYFVSADSLTVLDRVDQPRLIAPDLKRK